MANLVMLAADGSGGVWQEPVQLLPHGMDGDPAGFVAKLKEALPLVNTLRILFNEHSFNADGSLHPDMEAFLAEAVVQGFKLDICYGEGDAQNIGIGSGRWPFLTNSQAYAALQENYGDVAGAWTRMMDWMDAHGAVKAGVYGWELMNESAAYRHSIRKNGAGEGLSEQDFVKLYADHAIALSDLIQARAEGKVLVGGWGYNGDFLTLAEHSFGGQSAVDYLRAGVGADLVWSAHLYPGWMGTDQATSPDALIARLNDVYAPVAGDAVLITEINAHGEVDNAAAAPTYEDYYTAVYEWFAEQGIGFGWYPAVQTGSSHLVTLDWNGGMTYRHQHSLAHALHAFSLGITSPADDGNQVIDVALKAIRLRNEDYEIAAGEATFDSATAAGFAFGYAGNDTLRGTDQSNDFVYGGRGQDILLGFGADDFLYGQLGNDDLRGAAGIDNLFGGYGNDTLDGGSGNDFMAGGRNDDTYVVDAAGDHVREYAAFGNDTVLTNLTAVTLWNNVENLRYTGAAAFVGTGNGLANRLTGGAGADTLIGGDGNDTLIGERGPDRLDGGTGTDLASYESATSGVIANLAAPTSGTAAGEAAGDVLVAIEGLLGSAHADLLTGNAGANLLAGNGGNDLLQGRAGADRLLGGAGFDVASYHAANGAVIATLGAVTTGAAAGEAAGDVFDSIEGLRGSAFGDRLSGNSLANTLQGLSGNDTLSGRAGNDGLTGGAGADCFVFGRSFDADRVTDFENNIDTLAFTGLAGVTSVAKALGHAVQQGGNVFFDFGQGDTLLVLNTTLAALGDDILLLA